MKDEAVTNGQRVQVLINAFRNFVGKFAPHDWGRWFLPVSDCDLEIRQYLGRYHIASTSVLEYIGVWSCTRGTGQPPKVL
jgi:hypothetical protein